MSVSFFFAYLELCVSPVGEVVSFAGTSAASRLVEVAADAGHIGVVEAAGGAAAAGRHVVGVRGVAQATAPAFYFVSDIAI